MEITWSVPYYGIQYSSKISGYYCSIMEYNGVTELKLWYPGCQFSPLVESYANLDKAKLAGEKWLIDQTSIIRIA